MAVIIQIISIVFGLLLLTSCVNTENVRDEHDPEEYLQVKGPTSIEEEIKAKGVDYFCENIFYSSEGHEKVCYVEKVPPRRLRSGKFGLHKRLSQ